MSGHRVAERHEFGPIAVEIVEWRDLRGMTDPSGITALAAAKAADVAVRQVRIEMSSKAEVTVEAGALQFWKGRFDVENTIPAGRVMRRLLGSIATGDRAFRPTYRGKGEIWLEPGFGHFNVVGLGDESVIVDQGCFYVAGPGVRVEAKVQSNVSSALFGGEGLFQTHITGPGFCILQSPVPDGELVKLDVAPGEKVAVDGPFALLRTSNLHFSVGKSSRGWLGTATSGEGLLHHFENRGHEPGQVWVSPLEPVYGSFASPSAQINQAGAAAPRRTT